MATESRRPPPAVGDQLLQQPYRFRFFQAVRLLRLKHPGVDLEALLQFKSEVSLAFPASEIVGLRTLEEDSGRYELTVAFLGLLGRNSLLPDHYLERAQALARQKDRAMLDFLDLFNNRLTTLFYQAWEKSRFYLKRERREKDELSSALEALAGLHTGETSRPLPFDLDLVRVHAGVFMRGVVSAEAACQVFRTAFPGVGFELLQFDPQQLPLEDESRFQLSRRSRGNQLGRFCPLGRKVWDVQSRVRLKVGPLPRARWEGFGPEGEEALRLHSIWRQLTGGDLELVVERVLASEAARGWQLGERSHRLGRSAWLGRRHRAGDGHDRL